MRVLYDYQIFIFQKYGGISRYYTNLFDTFKKNYDSKISIDLALTYSDNYYLNNSNLFSVKDFFIKNQFKGRAKVLSFLNNMKVKRSLNKMKHDIFHPTYYNPYFIKYLDCKLPFVLTVYDMIHEIYPQLFSKKDKTSLQKEIMIKKASRIIAISNNTKKDIIKFYGVSPDKIDVIHLANYTDPANLLPFNPTFKVPTKYLLFVGLRGGYKNFNFLLNSVAPILHEDRNLFLICVGGGNFTNNEVEKLNYLKINNQVCQMDVEDKELYYLYKNALCFIFPSLYEGFGIPILEAFTCNCPVILTNSSCFPEVARDAAHYFNPNDSDDLTLKIHEVIYQKGLSKELKEKGKERARFFSNELVAQQTLETYLKTAKI